MCLSGERTDLETSLELLRSFGNHHIWLNGGSLGCAIVSSLDLTRFPEVEKLILCSRQPGSHSCRKNFPTIIR